MTEHLEQRLSTAMERLDENQRQAVVAIAEALANVTGSSLVALTPRIASTMEARDIAGIVIALALSLDREQQMVLVDNLIELIGIGPPLPVLINPRDDAKWWADNALREEIAAYASACVEQTGRNALALRERRRLLAILWNSMSNSDKRVFIGKATGKHRRAA